MEGNPLLLLSFIKSSSTSRHENTYWVQGRHCQTLERADKGRRAVADPDEGGARAACLPQGRGAPAPGRGSLSPGHMAALR